MKTPVPPFGVVTIIGVGLLGGSLGLALKKRRLAKHIRGVGHRESSLAQAQRIGAIDTAHLDARAAVHDADLVVLCTPAARVTDYLDAIRPHCSARTAVTDVASTKSAICGYAQDIWPRPRRFVGSHPMAGSERSGPEHADAGLFEGAYTFVESSGGVDPDARRAIVSLWEAIGAIVVDVAPDFHDELIARSSHVPHIVSSALAQLAGAGTVIRPFIGSGFRDTTRIAGGRAELWRDISLTNADAIRAGLETLIEQLHHVSLALDQRDALALEQFFEAGRKARGEALDDP